MHQSRIGDARSFLVQVRAGRMRRAAFFPAVAAASVALALGAPETTAGVVGLRWYGEVAPRCDGGGFYVADLYLICDDVDDTLESITEATIQLLTFTGPTYPGPAEILHSDVFSGPCLPSGSWSPNAFLPPLGLGDPAKDSFLMIGGGIGSLLAPSNTTVIVEKSMEGFAFAGGWFNETPTNLQGKVSPLPFGGGLGVWIARLFSSSCCDPIEAFITLTPHVNTGPGTPFYPAAPLTTSQILHPLDSLNSCGGSTHDCFTVGEPGCTDIECCWAVSSVVPWCNDHNFFATGWDAYCVALATSLCEGGSGLDCCYEPHPGPGCRSEGCETIVCAYAPSCCETAWDVFCADFANFGTVHCAGRSDLNGDEIVDGSDLGLLLGQWDTIDLCTTGDGSTVGGGHLGQLLANWTVEPPLLPGG